jgi:hypothetical protein
MTQPASMDLDGQATARQLLDEGARLLYTVAAGQFWELGDVNAWLERFNAAREQLGLRSDAYGAIGQRSDDADPLIENAQRLLGDVFGAAQRARDDFYNAVEQTRRGSGGAG